MRLEAQRAERAARIEAAQRESERREAEARKAEEERARAEEERRAAAERMRIAEARREALAAPRRAIDRAFTEYMAEQRRLGQSEGWWSSWLGGRCAPARAPDEWARTLHRLNTDPTLTERPLELRASVWGRGPIISRGRDTGDEWAVIVLEARDAPQRRRAFLISTDPFFCEVQMARERLGLPFDVPGGASLPITF
jgi:hypothetical protein